jgi:hypothetical protein
MKRSIQAISLTIVTTLLLMPAILSAQSEQTTAQAPPIEQPLVREGDFAAELVNTLGLSTTSDDTEAETVLGSVGISPRNGWIADYPVTPDILNEIRNSIYDAVDSGKVKMTKDDAEKAFETAKADLDLDVRSYEAGEPHEVNPAGEYPSSSALNTYYYDEGPPIVTYYAPPPDYYYLYSWVPCPFWWSDFWFPGFFVLNDFDRVIHFHHRAGFITNHYRVGHHRVFRIDPSTRFHGNTYAGIGAPRGGHYLSTRVRNGARSVFNRSRISPPVSGRTFQPGRTFRAPSRGTHTGGRTFRAPSRGTHIGGRTFRAPSGGRTFAPSRGGTFRGPSGGRSGSVGGGQRR